MDRIHRYIKENAQLYGQGSREKLLENMALRSGSFWIEDGLEPWERLVHWPEFELLSAFEFLRPELSDHERANLDGWIAKYSGWRDRGILFSRYRDSFGSRFTWKEERADAEETLGRIIPKSHWWYWPPEE